MAIKQKVAANLKRDVCRPAPKLTVFGLKYATFSARPKQKPLGAVTPYAMHGDMAVRRTLCYFHVHFKHQLWYQEEGIRSRCRRSKTQLDHVLFQTSHWLAASSYMRLADWLRVESSDPKYRDSCWIRKLPTLCPYCPQVLITWQEKFVFDHCWP